MGYTFKEDGNHKDVFFDDHFMVKILVAINVSMSEEEISNNDVIYMDIELPPTNNMQVVLNYN